jgi:aldehyde dehydrogenase (NAD+)
MRVHGDHYIDRRRVSPSGGDVRGLVDPADETVWAEVATGGGVADVDLAVAAARRAFAGFSATPAAERAALIDRIIAACERRMDELSQLIAREVGVPVGFRAQVTGPLGHMQVARDLARDYAFERQLAGTIVRREPIEVCAPGGSATTAPTPTR